MTVATRGDENGSKPTPTDPAWGTADTTKPNPDQGEQEVASRERAQGRAIAPTRVGRLRDRGRSTASSAAKLTSRYTSTPDAWSETPAPVRDLLVRTESRDWVPGEHAPILEWTGVAYAWLVAIPGTALLFALAWIVQRPTRFGCAWLALWVLVNAVHLILAWQHGGVWTFLWPWQVLPRPWQALP